MHARPTRPPWHETDDLTTDADGDLWVTVDGRMHCLGPVADLDTLDAVPVPLLGQYEEHADKWVDAMRWDERREADGDYREQQGF